MYCDKLYDFKIKIPDDKLVIIADYNDSFKTKLLNYLYDYFNDENVFYFKENRKMQISKTQIENYNLLSKCNGNNILKIIEYCYDMSDPFEFEKIQIGYPITCGYLQILNFIFSEGGKFSKNLSSSIIS